MQILLVDDNLSYLKLLGGILREEGYEVFAVEDGKQARELLDMQYVDVVVSDVYMPYLDGVWLHSYVREFSSVPDVPFIFISGREDKDVGELIVDPKMDFFVSKEAPVEGLLKLLQGFDSARRLKTA